MFTADFETTTDKNDCRVWAWAVCEIGVIDNIVIGNSIESFFETCEESGNLILYFHNLKFDGEFCISYLLKHRYEYVETKKLYNKQFNALISDEGQFYKIKIRFENGNSLELRDSMKLLNYSVDEIAKAFHLDIQKLEIDYNVPRGTNHILTKEETEYLKHDVQIMSLALDRIFKMGFEKLTQGSCALEDFKSIIGKKRFRTLFPEPNYDKDIRKAYKGGFTYLNPIYADKDVGEGNVFDVNSLYPSRMYYCDLPWGEPKFYDGEYVEDAERPLYIQLFKCEFEIKEGYLPTIQLKGNSRFIQTEYVTSSNGDIVPLCLTNVDFELFLKHYNVYNLEYIRGWKFRASKDLFKKYIDKWMQEKIKAGKEHNPTMRNWSKIMLNSLYGKFALDPICAKKHPYLDKGIVKYRTSPPETREALYLPVGAFITAYARRYTIETSQKIKEYSIEKYGKDMYIYSDTDSIHTTLPVEDVKKFIEIDDYKLGAWAHESHFTRARFLRPKTYIEEIAGKLHVTCAGLPDKGKEQVTWENFHPCATYTGKLMPVHVDGGIVLVDKEFNIRG